MRYIRTKDGRIGIWDKTGSIFFPPNSSCVYGYFNDYTDKHLQMLCSILKNDFHTEMIKQADTIEELCDEFVAIDNNNNWFMGKQSLMSFETFVYINNDLIKKKYKVYGAIWTDKGLIYVAKMNKKGELELL